MHFGMQLQCCSNKQHIIKLLTSTLHFRLLTDNPVQRLGATGSMEVNS